MTRMSIIVLLTVGVIGSLVIFSHPPSATSPNNIAAYMVFMLGTITLMIVSPTDDESDLPWIKQWLRTIIVLFSMAVLVGISLLKN